MMLWKTVLMLTGCLYAALSASAHGDAPEISLNVDPCDQLMNGPTQAYRLYLPREGSETPIYLPAAWQANVPEIDDWLFLPVRASDFSVTFPPADADADNSDYLGLVFAAHAHPDVAPPYEVDRSGQYFTEGPYGLYRTEGLVEDEVLREYRDEPTDKSSMYILCRHSSLDGVERCHMAILGTDFDTLIHFHSRELSNWEFHRDRAIRFRNCATNPR